jgi:hypothetical protein
MKRYIATLIVICGIFTLGYLAGSHKATYIEGQRDRLADYIHQYADMQAEWEWVSNKESVSHEDSLCSILSAVNAWEEEDNNAGDLGFTMNSRNWYFAY